MSTKGRFFQKKALNRFDSCISTCLGEFAGSFINGVESFNDFLGVARLKITFPVINVVVWFRTDGTITGLDQ